MAIQTVVTLLKKPSSHAGLLRGGDEPISAIVAAALSIVQGGSPDEKLKEIVAGHPHDVSPHLWEAVCRACRSLAMKVNAMSDETTNPEPSTAASIPGRPSNRIALLALTISFGINVAFWGSFICWFWGSVSMAVGRCALLAAFMAVVHCIGYRLWQRQSVQDQGDSSEWTSRPISSAYWPPTKTALLQQGIVFILALLMLDMGQTICEAVTAIVAYWLAVWHYRGPPTKFAHAGRYILDSIWFPVHVRFRRGEHCRLSEGH